MNAANDATRNAHDPDRLSWDEVAACGLQPAPADAGTPDDVE